MWWMYVCVWARLAILRKKSRPAIMAATSSSSSSSSFPWAKPYLRPLTSSSSSRMLFKRFYCLWNTLDMIRFASQKPFHYKLKQRSVPDYEPAGRSFLMEGVFFSTLPSFAIYVQSTVTQSCSILQPERLVRSLSFSKIKSHLFLSLGVRYNRVSVS